jgi:homospermidine synthase
MPKSQLPNLVLELGDTNIPADSCKLPCVDRHYIVVRPEDYNKRKKVLKHGVKFVAFTITAKTRKDLAQAIIDDATRYQFHA